VTPSGTEGVVVLRFASTAAERGVLDEWLGGERSRLGDRVSVLDADDAALGTRLREPGDPQVVPVRVTWLPRPRAGGDRAAGVAGLLEHTRILRRDPGRRRVVAGDPATVSALRSRFQEGTGGGGGEEFAGFVRRQAVLALERAERRLVGDRYKVARLVGDEITASARFRERVARLATTVDRPEGEVLAEAAGYLDEMAASSSRLAIDTWEQLVRVALRGHSVDVDTARLEELRELGRHRALVFLPSHRSYLDPLVLRTALHEHGFAPNHVLGGVNVAFWPVGPLARRSGYVFIRRSVRDNPVYKLTLREYVGYLVRKRFNLEWYIEGGRTRTGKLRPPRLGLLAYLVEAVMEGAADDVLLVPTSIVYEHLPEVGAMAAEGTGGARQREGFGWLLGYLRQQSSSRSVVHLRFGEPLSLRQGMSSSSNGSRGGHAVEKVAFEVLHRINRATPVTAPSLVTLALLGAEDRALTLDEVCASLVPLCAYVERRGLPTTEGAASTEPRAVRRALEALQHQGLADRFADGVEPVWRVAPSRHLEAAFYRNGIAHFFVNRALVELIVVRASEERLDFLALGANAVLRGGSAPRPSSLRDDSLPPAVLGAWEEALRLRDLLKFEFFFAGKAAFAQELRDELAVFDPAWEQRAGDPEAILERLTGSHLYLAHRIVRPYVEAYLVVAERLAARDPRAPIEERAFLTECLGAARQQRMQQRLRSPEAISTELFRTGLALAANRDLVDPGGEAVVEGRRALAAELATVARRLETLRDLALRPRAT
jgi:glycerol-3-phosphate O-acyltransferase